jgi:hypothetical protein
VHARGTLLRGENVAYLWHYIITNDAQAKYWQCLGDVGIVLVFVPVNVGVMILYCGARPPCCPCNGPPSCILNFST